MSPHPTRELLSAYRDGALSPTEQARVHAHLRTCPDCGRLLAQYAGLARALRAEPISLPSRRLRADLHARLARRSSRAAARLAWGGLALAAGVVLAIAALRPPADGPPPAGDLARNPCAEGAAPADCAGDPTGGTVAARNGAVESARPQPAAAVAAPAAGGTVPRPEEATQPGQAYAVASRPAPSTQTPPASPAGAVTRRDPPPTPTAPVAASPVSTATPHAALRDGAPTPASTPEAEKAALSPTPVLMLVAAEPGLPLDPMATLTPTVPGCPIPPGGDFAGLLALQRSVAQALGCAAEPLRSTAVAAQPFERGKLIWLAETRQILVLAADGRWLGLADTWRDGEPDPTLSPPAGLTAPVRVFGKAWRQPGVRDAVGWAVGSERGGRGVVQQFSRGVLVRADDRLAHLRADGTWQELLSPSATPPAPALPATPTRGPSPTPSPTPPPLATAPASRSGS